MGSEMCIRDRFGEIGQKGHNEVNEVIQMGHINLTSFKMTDFKIFKMWLCLRYHIAGLEKMNRSVISF